ncbi:hypothetical protein EVAR_29670_1 [Eumeta japonica]|uniref:Uncharacterized protein n=1 Tax=Eumeta variegata TaxID=151549 RepID=A0A4C1WA94_EUMVA|nr:hypothetical protein EVAR_29670_1 [Eumeta japonica]
MNCSNSQKWTSKPAPSKERKKETKAHWLYIDWLNAPFGVYSHCDWLKHNKCTISNKSPFDRRSSRDDRRSRDRKQFFGATTDLPLESTITKGSTTMKHRSYLITRFERTKGNGVETDLTQSSIRVRAADASLYL